MAVEVVSVEEAGRILGCKRSRVFELLSDGVLERAPRYGRALRIYRDSVDRALMPASNGRKRRAPIAPDWDLGDVPLEG